MEKELPTGWTSLPIGQLAEVRLGRQRSPDKANGPHMAPYLRAANVSWRGLDLSDVKEMAFTPAEQAIYRLQAGDILVGEASGSAGEVGKPGMWANEIPGCCFQNTLIRVRPPQGMTRFLYFQLLHFALSGRFIDEARGVGIHHLGADRFSKIEISVAPRSEQDRIVAAIEQNLTDIDAGVVALERALANLKQHRASILQAACEGKLVPTEAELARKEGREYEPAEMLLKRILKERRERWETDQLAKMQAKGQAPKDERWKEKYECPTEPDVSCRPPAPEGWHRATVEQLAASVDYGSSFKTSEDASGVPVLRMGIVVDGKLVTNDLKYLPVAHDEFPDLLLAPGDLLFNRTNSAELVGKAAVYRGHPHPCSYASYLIRVRFLGGCISSYVSHCLNSPMGRTWAASVAVQQTGQANVNGTKLQAFILPLPPLAEQHRITAEVDRLLSVADQTETAVRALLVRGGRLRQAVLARAFEGKLVPQDPNDEPASTTLEKLQHAKALAAKTRASQEPNAGTVEPASPSLPAEHKSKSPRKGPQGAPSMRPRLPKNAEKVPELRSLEAVLADDKGAMRPEALLKGAGYTAEQVDEFFGELRRLVRAGKIDEDRSPEPRLRLRGGA